MPLFTTATTRRLLATLTLGLGLAACGSSSSSSSSLQDNVGQAFATCNEAKIKFLASKHNVQLAFRPCGNNNFTTFRWSPDGLNLYFQLLMTGYVMDADAGNKATQPLPTTTPVGPGTWLTANRLAVPVQDADDPNGTVRLAVFDLPERPAPPAEGEVQTTTAQPARPGQLRHLALPGMSDIVDATQGPQPHLLWLLTSKDGGPRSVWQVDTRTGDVTPALDWLTLTPDTLTVSGAQDAVVVGIGNEVILYALSSGIERGRWKHATRGSLHPNGRWLALEYAGSPTSLYYQRSWDELSEAARAREERRAKRFEEGLPEWMPKEGRPPTLGIVDLELDARWELTAFLGDRFQWYEAFDGFASFVLWGFEGKQFKRNVALTDLTDRLDAIANARAMLGVVPFVAPGETPPDAATPPPSVSPASPPPSPSQEGDGAPPQNPE